MSSKIYVVIKHESYEGYSEPSRAFSTLRDAEIYRAGARDGYASSTRIFEMPIDDVTEPPRMVE